jgi:hypothetical protein
MASHRDGLGLHRGSMWGLWWTKQHWDRFSPSTSVSPANHSTNFSIIIITLAGTIGHWWPQCQADLGFHPPLYQLKKMNLVNKDLTMCIAALIQHPQFQFFYYAKYLHQALHSFTHPFFVSDYTKYDI